jgi:hypothetical protein
MNTNQLNSVFEALGYAGSDGLVTSEADVTQSTRV